MDRMYSILTVKAVEDGDLRVIRGVATNGTPDRVGDIVEPLGVAFNNPMPLLLHHQTDKPVGLATFDKPTKAGISFTATFAKIDEPGALKDRVDEAWQSVKAGLIRAVSIGFKPVLDQVERIKGGGIRFLQTEVLELSLVTIPANRDATISTIKSLDTAMLAAIGQKHHVVARLVPPGASGISIPTPPKEAKTMAKTFAEQISAFEASRVAKSAQMAALMDKAGEDGSTLDAEQTETYDTLEGEVKAIDDHLVRLSSMEKLNASRAVTVEGAVTVEKAAQVRGGAVITVKGDNLPPGIEFARYAMCLATAKGDAGQAERIAAARYPDQPRIQLVLKNAVNAGTTTDSTWAGALVDYQQFAGDFVEYLRPMTIIGKFGAGGVPSLRRVPFNITIPTQTSGGTGYWVGEGAPKPLTDFDFAPITLRWAKVATIAVLTEELVRFSNPNAEALVRDSLAAAIVARIDTDFVDPAKVEVSNVSPASILNGATNSLSSGNDADAVRADLATVFGAFIAANLTPVNGVWIMSSSVSLALSLMRNALSQPEFPSITMQGGTFEGLPVISSQYVPAGIVALVNASDIYLADDGQVVVDASREASLQMLDNPTNNSASGTATSMVSMFQTNSIAIRAERFINWKRRRSAAVYYLRSVDWGTSGTT